MVADPADIPAIEAELEGAVARARDELVDAKLLADTKSAMKYGFLMRLETAQDVAFSLIAPIVNTGTIEAVDDYYRTLESLTHRGHPRRRPSGARGPRPHPGDPPTGGAWIMKTIALVAALGLAGGVASGCTGDAAPEGDPHPGRARLAVRGVQRLDRRPVRRTTPWARRASPPHGAAALRRRDAAGLLSGHHREAVSHGRRLRRVRGQGDDGVPGRRAQGQPGRLLRAVPQRAAVAGVHRGRLQPREGAAPQLRRARTTLQPRRGAVQGAALLDGVPGYALRAPRGGVRRVGTLHHPPGREGLLRPVLHPRQRGGGCRGRISRGLRPARAHGPGRPAPRGRWTPWPRPSPPCPRA